MQINKAVIAAAGQGSRFLPLAKSVPKEMLPIIDRPVIQLVAEDLAAAGVKEIIIVGDDRKKAIKDYFSQDAVLESRLGSAGLRAAAAELRRLRELAVFSHVNQSGQPTGSARPLLNTEHLLGDQPFFFFFADDFFVCQPSAASQMLQAFEKVGQPIVALHRVSSRLTQRYGIAELARQLEGGLCQLKRIVDCPKAQAAPSKLAVGGGYLLTPDILPLVRQLKPGPKGEIGISDAFNELAGIQDIYGLEIDGQYRDAGNPEAYLQTVISAALAHPQYAAGLRDFLNEKLGGG